MNERGAGRRLLRDDVVELVSASIIDGSLRPGTKFTVQKLSQAILISPGPVRAALPILAARGFIELRPGRSARVCTFDEAATDAAVALGVLMRGVVSISIRELNRTATRYAVETVQDAINTIARPAERDLRALAVDGYQRWAMICPNRTLGEILAARSGALAVECTTGHRTEAQPLITAALHALAFAIDRGNLIAAQAAVTQMHGLAMGEPRTARDIAKSTNHGRLHAE